MTQADEFLENRLSPIDKEIRRYEGFSLAPKNVNILQWWKTHENVLPLLSKLAKKVLTIPASSSKSERVFSCGGNFVTPKRNKLGAKKVEDLILIKENKSRIEEFKQRSAYNLEKIKRKPFEHISIDQVIANLAVEDDADMFEEDIFENDEEGEVLFFINGDSDVDSEEEYTDDDESSDIEEI